MSNCFKLNSLHLMISYPQIKSYRTKSKQTENDQEFFIHIGNNNTGSSDVNDGRNGGGNAGGGSKKKDHSLFIYVLIGLIGLAAVLLVIIIIKIRRQKSMLSFTIST